MNKCTNPNYIQVVTDPLDETKKKVIFYGHRGKVGDLRGEDYKNAISGVIEVPCGQCVYCRLEYSRVWANRCYLESLCHPYNWFITLTYDDNHLVYGPKGFPTLEKDAISSFIRKLRDRLGHDIKVRYFACGEYGDTTMRPHYHLIVFGAPLDDLTIDIPDYSKEVLPSGKYPIYRRKNRNHDYVFYSDIIYQCWQKGKIEVEECSWNTSAYVSRYVMKKQKGVGKEIYDRLGLLPEYLRMSNRPGIGADWLNYNKEKLLKYDYLSVKNDKGVQTTRPPRYFEKLMMKDEESLEAALMESNKINRIINARKRCDESKSLKPINDIDQAREEEIQKKNSVLKRDFT